MNAAGIATALAVGDSLTPTTVDGVGFAAGTSTVLGISPTTENNVGVVLQRGTGRHLTYQRYMKLLAALRKKKKKLPPKLAKVVQKAVAIVAQAAEVADADQLSELEILVRGAATAQGVAQIIAEAEYAANAAIQMMEEDDEEALAMLL
jgi:hypothetical protein